MQTVSEHERGFEAGYSAAIHDAKVPGSRAYIEVIGDYNGWKNYPTWAVNLWLSNDEGLFDSARQIALRSSHRYEAADAFKTWVRDELAPDLGASFAADLLGYALDCVDWDEVADFWLDEYGEDDANEGHEADALANHEVMEAVKRGELA